MKRWKELFEINKEYHFKNFVFAVTSKFVNNDEMEFIFSKSRSI